MLLAAVVWALAACVLPWVVRGRWLALDALLAAAWASALVAATAAVGGLLGTAVPHPRPLGAVFGGVLAALIALLGAGLRGRAGAPANP
jgi:hypothetical protein